jgi:AcrR family transcriptional regulator
MALHEEVGPRATTISAIAARAGVQRLTVYRHFPDETAVFQACTSHWLSLNPPPGPEAWEDAGDLSAQRAAALAAFHGYYARTRAMWDAAHRDVADVPALREPMAQFGAYVAGVADALGADLGPLGRASLHHGLVYSTWASLEAQSLEEERKRKLVLAWIEGAARADAASWRCRCSGRCRSQAASSPGEAGEGDRRRRQRDEAVLLVRPGGTLGQRRKEGPGNFGGGGRIRRRCHGFGLRHHGSSPLVCSGPHPGAAPRIARLDQAIDRDRHHHGDRPARPPPRGLRPRQKYWVWSAFIAFSRRNQPGSTMPSASGRRSSGPTSKVRAA